MRGRTPLQRSSRRSPRSLSVPSGARADAGATSPVSATRRASHRRRRRLSTARRPESNGLDGSFYVHRPRADSTRCAAQVGRAGKLGRQAQQVESRRHHHRTRSAVHSARYDESSYQSRVRARSYEGFLCRRGRPGGVFLDNDDIDRKDVIFAAEVTRRCGFHVDFRMTPTAGVFRRTGAAVGMHHEPGQRKARDRRQQSAGVREQSDRHRGLPARRLSSAGVRAIRCAGDRSDEVRSVFGHRVLDRCAVEDEKAVAVACSPVIKIGKSTVDACWIL